MGAAVTNLLSNSARQALLEKLPIESFPSQNAAVVRLDHGAEMGDSYYLTLGKWPNQEIQVGIASQGRIHNKRASFSLDNGAMVDIGGPDDSYLIGLTKNEALEILDYYLRKKAEPKA